MKSVGGVPAAKPGESLPLVFERPNQDPLVFKAAPLWDWDEFDKLWPAPDPSPWQKMTVDGWVTDTDAPAYRDQLKQRRIARWQYTLIKSLEPSQIEWSKANLDRPETWKHVEGELAEFLSVAELNLLVAYVQDTNYMTADKLEGNRERFFQMLALRQQTKTTSQKVVPGFSESSAPALDSASSPPG